MSAALRLIDPDRETTSDIALAPEGVRVLVCDDNDTVRRLLSRALTKIGFEVSTASDVGPALALVQATPPDIAIIDLGMPTSGLDLVRHLKLEYGTQMHVCVLSGRAEEAARVFSFDAGADDYLLKPMSTLELQRRMIAVARKQRAFVEARREREHADRLRAYAAEAAALLAHDLNNGLGIGVSNLTYLSETLELDDDRRQALEQTLHALSRMSSLVANFVDIGRFEDEALRPDVKPESMRALLGEVVAMHTPPPSRGIRVEIDCPDQLTADLDHALVLRVLHNLVGNATRYCSTGGVVRVAAKAWESADRATGVEITVSNTGPHVPAEVAANLFSKYARGSNGKRGMGLYFCRLACEAHGGSVALEPTEAGPAFAIRLPGPQH